MISGIGPLSVMSAAHVFIHIHVTRLLGLLNYDSCNIKTLLSVSPLPLLRYAGDQTYFDEIKQFYYRDEFSHQVQEWNRQRTLAIERALTQFLYPQMAKELKSKLIAEAKESIVRVICHDICLCLFYSDFIISLLHTGSQHRNLESSLMNLELINSVLYFFS